MDTFGEGQKTVILGIIFFLFFFLYFICICSKLTRWSQSKLRSTPTAEETAAPTESVQARTQFQTRVQYPNSLHLPVELLHERSRSNSTPFPNSSINFPRITIADTESDSNPPTYERSLQVSPITLRVSPNERARSRSVTNIPIPHHRNLQNHFPTSSITFPRSAQTQSVATPPPTYEEVLRSFAL